MPQAYETDHAGFEAALIAWLSTYAGIATGSVRFLNQDIGRPAWPFATLHILQPGAADGIDSESHFYNASTERVDVVTHGPRTMSVQIAIYDTPGRDVQTKLIGAIAALRSPKVKDDLRAAGLGFLQVLSPPRRDDNQVGDRWEWVATADLEFSYTSIFTDDSTGDPEGGLNWIETVEDPTINH